MTWHDAMKFCAWLSKKEGKAYELPTEAEWEYACRAGTTTAYSFGDDPKALPAYAWYRDSSGYHTHPVGGKKPNPWGLYDMHGDVCQWCADGYAAYQSGVFKDPKGPDNDENRIFRGGSWDADAKICRSAFRNRVAASSRFAMIGFRVALRPAGEGALPPSPDAGNRPVQAGPFALSPGNTVTAAAFSPDGRRLVMGGATLRLWNLGPNKELHNFGSMGCASVLAAAWSADGRRVLVGGSDLKDGKSGVAILFEADTGKVVMTFTGHPTPVGAVALSPDGREVLTGAGDVLRKLMISQGVAQTVYQDTEVRRWDVATGKELGRYDGPTAPTHSVAFSADGKRIFAAGSVSDPAVYSWDVNKPEGLRLKFPKGLTSTYAVLTPDGGKVAHLGTNWAFYIYDLTDGAQLKEICHSAPLAHIPAAAPTAPVWSRDGRFVACSSWQYPNKPGKAPIYLVDAASGQVVRTFEGHKISTKALAVSDDDRLIFSGSDDGNRLWEVTSEPAAGVSPMPP